MRVVLYTRVSSQQQADSGLGLEAQLAALKAQATAFNWEIVAHIEDAGVSGTLHPSERRLLAAMDLCRDGLADAVAAVRWDRITRSVVHGQEILDRSARQNFTIATQDIGIIDPSTAHGRFMAGLMSLLAQRERDLVSERTSAALQAKKDRGEKLGPAFQVLPDVADYIYRLSKQGMSTREIAKTLDLQNVMPPGGKSWAKSTVHRVIEREKGRRYD